jgi:hypothetical protein
MAFSSIEIRLGGLWVSIQSELNYPDGIDDLTSRALLMFKEGVKTAKANDIDITVMSLLTGYPEDTDE